jgi:hypothetical protein
MHAWSEALSRVVTFSKGEVTDASELSAAWVDGYLAGNAPSAGEMFGPQMADAFDEDSRFDRWRRAVADYRESGWWPYSPWRDTLPFPPAAELPDYVWELRGDEVWTWSSSTWLRADPQPALDGRVLAGSVCATRQHHSMVVASTAHIVCEDCGETRETVPDGMSLEDWVRVRPTYVAEVT